MSGGLFGGYNKLQNAVYSRIDEANAIRLEKAAREYSDYMKNAYRLMNDPNLREIAERRIGDTAIPSAMRTASRETGEMNFGNVLKEKPGTVSAEQMYGVKPNRGTENQDFPEWNESDKKQAQIDGERVNALSLKERLTMIVNNVFPKTLPHVKLGKMPTAVKATIGIDSDVPLVMSKDKARAVMISKSKAEAAVKNENRNWHGLGTDGLEKVVAALENPLRAVKQENGRYGFVVEIEEGGKPFYVAIELDTKANYRGKMEKANVVVSAFGTDFNYVKNQITKGTELEIKKEPVSQVTHGRQLPNGVNETDSNGDVPSPNANIPQNGNGVNTLDAESSAAKAQQNSENAAQTQQRKPGTVSAEQMYGVKLSQENKNEDFAEWAEKEDAEKVTNGQQIEENASYSRKIDNIESLSEGGYIPVGRVLKGSALNNIGLASTNIYFDKSKIVKSLDEHSDHITKEVLKQIPQILNEPMVITEANADNTVNVFGNVYIGSSPLMVGVMVTKSRDGKTEINKIRTVHARRDAGKKITDSSVLYLNPNIEKTQTWFQALGNDVPLGGTKFGFIRRITDKLKKVNSENQAAKGTELKIKNDTSLGGVGHTPFGRTSNGTSSDVSKANIPQNGNGVNTPDAENSAAGMQQNSENAAKVQQRKPGTVSAEQMYGVKLSQENKNEDFAEWAEKEDAKKKKAAEKEAILAEKQKNADSRSIRTDMTDDERYEALKNEKIKIEPYNSEKLKGENVEQLNATTSKEARKYIKTLAEKFEVFKKYISENARIEFRFSRNNLAESASKQGKIKAEYAEMLSATDAIVQNAVLVEAHKDKYAGTTREDKTLLQTDVLLSAFADENGIVPVRLTVKEYKDKDNSLYALITLEKIETEVSGRGESLATTPEPYPVSEMSIPDIVSKIKPTDGKILKYLPDKLLNAEQLEGKRAALAKDKGRIEGFSQKGDFAAKVQQAETEEEARLRTLYESEPTGKYAGTEAGESKAELDEKVKEAKENAVGDDELKEKPKTEKQKILKRRIEKAGLDMTVEEIVGFAQGLGRIKGFFGSERKDFARIFDDVSEGSRTIRNDLHKLLEVPHRQAQANSIGSESKYH